MSAPKNRFGVTPRDPRFATAQVYVTLVREARMTYHMAREAERYGVNDSGYMRSRGSVMAAAAGQLHLAMRNTNGCSDLAGFGYAFADYVQEFIKETSLCDS